MDFHFIEAVDDFAVSPRYTVSASGHYNMNILTIEGVKALQDESFKSNDFWEGYKLYCFARYSHCGKSKKRFLASKMGRLVCQMKAVNDVRWELISDDAVRDVWAMMEEYGTLWHGKDWKNLRALMEEFDDVKTLSMTEKGCLLLQLVEEDEDGTEILHRTSQTLKIKDTGVFEEIRGRLEEVGSHLDRLMKSPMTSSHVKVKRKSENASAELSVPWKKKK